MPDPEVNGGLGDIGETKAPPGIRIDIDDAADLTQPGKPVHDDKQPRQNTGQNGSSDNALESVQDIVEEATVSNGLIVDDNDKIPSGKGAADIDLNLGLDSDSGDDGYSPDTVTKPLSWSHRRVLDYFETFDHEEQVLAGSLLKGDILYGAYRKRLEGQGRNNDKGSSLVKGLIDYIRVVDERLAQMETQLKDIKLGKATEFVEPVQEPEASEKGEEEAGQESAPETRWAEILLETRFYPCEEALHPDGSYQNTQDQKGTYSSKEDPRYLIRALFNWASKTTEEVHVVKEGDEPIPGEIDLVAFMISSKPIARYFEKRLGLAVDVTDVVRVAKPFRPLIRNLQSLKDHLAQLEEKYGSVGILEAQEGAEPTQPNHPETQQQDPLLLSGTPDMDDKIDEFDRPEALEHFRYLLRFVHKYLGGKVTLFDSIRSVAVDKVAYEDLWMLFDVGDTVYSPMHEGGVVFENISDEGDQAIVRHISKRRHTPQAYRVVATLGGVPTGRGLVPRGGTVTDEDLIEDPLIELFLRKSNSQLVGLKQNISVNVPSRRVREDYTQLFVLCMYIDYDGMRYGTSTEIFSFKPFSGEIDIRSLEVFPLQFLNRGPSRGIVTSETKDIEPNEEAGGKADFLLERGRRFIEVTKLSHMSYKGQTIGKSREEIDSAVIIDFKLAFQEYQEEFPDKDSVVPTFTPLRKFWPQTPKTQILEYPTCDCPNMYCHDLYCVKDQYPDYQSKQVTAVDTNMKIWLEEFEADMSDPHGGYERFKKNMEDKDLVRLLPGVVPGFILRSRNWVQLDLNLLKDIQQEDNWNNLVLPKGHREIVQAMVETHSQGSALEPDNKPDRVEMDLVRGKGKGCIILLHGVPGVGKTSTAETVAAYTKRPLYPITCGDIGFTPDSVEDNMGKHFKLAHKWGCVLLLDEADVFLAKRTVSRDYAEALATLANMEKKADVKRNGLVSVFLRILEYYSGILFLTTNRVGAIDDAFRSRLHLTLYYPKLTKNQTIKIWKTNLHKLKDINEERMQKGHMPIEFDRRKIIKWVEKHHEDIEWNGRQIRNAFQTAVALAQFKAKHENANNPEAKPKRPVMSTKHFGLIGLASIQFNEYLQLTHGDDEEGIAQLEKMRYSDRRPSMKPQQPKLKQPMNDDDDDTDSYSDSDKSSGKKRSKHDSNNDSQKSADESSSDSDSGESEKEKESRKGKKKSSSKPKSSKKEKEGGKKGK